MKAFIKPEPATDGDFTEEQTKYIMQHWHSDSVRSIADAIGRKWYDVYFKAVSIGLQVKLPAVQRADIVDAYKEHKTCKQLAEELGVCIYRVRNAEKAYGIKLKNSCKKTHT